MVVRYSGDRTRKIPRRARRDVASNAYSATKNALQKHREAKKKNLNFTSYTGVSERHEKSVRNEWMPVADAYEVAADAWEDAGKLDQASKYRKRARSIRRRFGRRTKIYLRYRQKGYSAFTAYQQAKKQSNWMIVEIIEKEPERIAWIARSASDAHVQMFVWQSRYRQKGRLYTINLDRDAAPDWLDAEFYDYIGASRTIFRKRWRSRSLRERADARFDVLGYVSIENFDSYPSEYSRSELKERFGI